MRKNLFLKITAVCLFVVMLLSFAACGKKDNNSSDSQQEQNNNNSNNNNNNNNNQQQTGSTLKPSDIMILADLANYSKSASDYNATAKTFEGETYDGKDCSGQLEKLQNRIDDKTEDVYLGKTESAMTKIFTKSTPEGIMGAIAKAALTFDEMVRVVDYIAGDADVDADIDSYIKEGKTSWTGLLTLENQPNWKWEDCAVGGNDLNAGWSFFDDWDLYDRLKEYAQDSDSGLTKANGKILNDIGTKEIAGDNASWQYRSILEKVYKPAKEGGLDLPGAAASRLATYLLEYGNSVVESDKMANGKIADYASTQNNSDYAKYFRKKVALPDNIPQNYNDAKTFWNPYAGLGDYDMLSYLLTFNEFYKGSYDGMNGLQSCCKLYGYYYQYNQTYYNVVLKNRDTYRKQLRYEKLDTYSTDEWLDYVAIQRNNYALSYRYKADFYQDFYKIHFEFQGRKETNEKSVYVISDVINGRTYTGEMRNAIVANKNGIAGQLAMSDWTWCYGGSNEDMTSYNTANTKYQEGKQKSPAEEYEGKYYYEFEQLKLAYYLMSNMTDNELSGALYYNCYAYSGSMISEIQGYEKDKVLITDAIKGWDKFTSIPDAAKSEAFGEEDDYAKGKMTVLQSQARADWDDASVDDRARTASDQDWNGMRGELKDAKEYDYIKNVTKSDDTSKTVWQVRCEYLEDHVVARYYSCCEQRISAPNTKNCTHAENPDGTAVTKEYETSCAVSKFVSTYEAILYYVAAQTQVEFDTPSVGYKTANNAEAIYTTGYKGNIAQLISDARQSSGSEAGRMMEYAEERTMTFKIGASFKEEIADKDSDDADWWTANATAKNNVTNFAKETITEKYNATDVKYTYSYDFQGWFLDKECKYLFNPEDDVDFNLTIYAGYKVTKSK